MPSHLNHTGEQLDTAIQMVLNNYADVSTVDASASDVLAGKKIVNALGAEITGEMPAATVTAQADILGSTLVDGGARLAIQVRSRAILSTPGYVSQGDTAIETLYVRAQGGGDQPQLHKPTVSVSGNVLTITDDPDNGDFVGWYKVYADGMYLGDSEDGSYDLSEITEPTAQITARACADHFVDSQMSDAATWLQKYTVQMYDGETFLQSEQVYYGNMPTYTPTKSGWRFVGWKDSNNHRVRAITEDCSLYAIWDDSRTIRAGTYYLKANPMTYSDGTKDGFGTYDIEITTSTSANRTYEGAHGIWFYSNNYYYGMRARGGHFPDGSSGSGMVIGENWHEGEATFADYAKGGKWERKITRAEPFVASDATIPTIWYSIFELEENE